MPSLQCERSAILLCGLGLALANALYAQSVGKLGDEISISGPRGGDQTAPQVSIGSNGGYAVWQDSVSDGVGASFGIVARKLNPDLSATSTVFRVNQIRNGPQENPQVALLKNGAATFVWQGGKLGNQDIYLRTMTAKGVLMPTNDVRVNAFTTGEQSAPVITCLTNGNLAVAWCSLHQDKGLEGVYARILQPMGAFVTAPFRVNQFTGNSQRGPAITTLGNGTFLVVWVSDNQGVSTMEVLRHTNRVHVYGRVFGPGAGKPLCDEFRINTRSNLCSSPSVAAWGERGFTVTWGERSDVRANGWDIYARTFSAFETPVTDAVLVNEVTEGNQVGAKIAQVGEDQLVVWSSPDGWREGVFGRFLRAGQPTGSQFLVNTVTNGSQIQPMVTGDKASRFLVLWSSFIGDSSFDIEAQRYIVDSSSATPPANGSDLIVTKSLSDQSSGIGVSPPGPAGTGGGSGVVPLSSSLRVSLANSMKGKILSWNTEPGRIYQVQCSTNCLTWRDLGTPRTAAATTDFMVFGSGENSAFYRVVCLP